MTNEECEVQDFANVRKIFLRRALMRSLHFSLFATRSVRVHFFGVPLRQKGRSVGLCGAFHHRPAGANVDSPLLSLTRFIPAAKDGGAAEKILAAVPHLKKCRAQLFAPCAIFCVRDSRGRALCLPQRAAQG